MAHHCSDSTKRNGRSNDIWLMDPQQDSSARLLVESSNGTWWGPIDFSPDNRKLLVLNYVSIADARAHEVDIKTGQSKLIAGSTEQASQNYPLAYNQTGKGIYLTSNKGSEFAHLIHFDLDQGTRQVLSSKFPWLVMSCRL